MDTLNLGDYDQILEILNGEWKLQLMADSKGDNVNFYEKKKKEAEKSSSVSWQYFDINAMKYEASCPTTGGLLTITQSGIFDIDKILRVVSRKDVKSKGSGAFLTNLLLGGGNDNNRSNLSGSMGAINLQQQI